MTPDTSSKRHDKTQAHLSGHTVENGEKQEDTRVLQVQRVECESTACEIRYLFELSTPDFFSCHGTAPPVQPHVAVDLFVSVAGVRRWLRRRLRDRQAGLTVNLLPIP